LLSRPIGILMAAVAAAGIAYAQATPPAGTQHELDVASFVCVWESIRDTHWQEAPGGLDWQEIREEFEPRVNAAKTRDEVRTILSEMLLRLGQTHFGIIPAGLYTALSAGGGGSNVTGIDLRILDDQVLVTEVVNRSPADAAGVRPGWILTRIREEEVGPLIQAVRLNKSIPGNLLELALASNFMRGLSGPPGATVKATFLNAEDKPVELEIPLAAPRGEISQFGNLPPLPVFYEEKRFGDVTYVRFNAPIHWREMYPTVETVGIESINGEDAYRVLQTPAEGSTVTTYYSVKTGLAIKSTTTLASQMGNIPVEAAMSEYKEFEGVLSPTKMVQNAAGQTINISIDSVQVNVDIPDERFDLPEAVQALVK
jgi:carboxyl-terminal processing protease